MFESIDPETPIYITKKLEGGNIQVINLGSNNSSTIRGTSYDFGINPRLNNSLSLNRNRTKSRSRNRNRSRTKSNNNRNRNNNPRTLKKSLSLSNLPQLKKNQSSKIKRSRSWPKIFKSRRRVKNSNVNKNRPSRPRRRRTMRNMLRF